MGLALWQQTFKSCNFSEREYRGSRKGKEESGVFSYERWKDAMFEYEPALKDAEAASFCESTGSNQRNPRILLKVIESASALHHQHPPPTRHHFNEGFYGKCEF